MSGAFGKMKDIFSHPSMRGTHFWAPTFKWGLVIAGLNDLRRPPQKISLYQAASLSATGLIWSRYSTQIIPVNYNLLSVNVFVALTSLSLVYRRLSYDFEQKKIAAAELKTEQASPKPQLQTE
eukprot:TRINITY_DN20166_c0_g1_i1.p1 TRINITY_DN20166_c0_g1~~TRINITY_DN20166_c0_g1_i1.p1  ORF type:complete len:123 (-),score=27.42 TRINITY_DN20166_c0_g1_i1:61-429(-)